MQHWYKAGTVNVTNSDDTIQGTATYWASAASPPVEGDLITFDFKTLYGVKTIVDDDAIVLDRPYEGPTESGRTYAVIRNVSATTNTRLSAQVSEVLAHLGDRITVSTTAPSAGQGNDGDIWIVVA